jgi:histidinol phosphatase-like PHP family hydrolase
MIGIEAGAKTGRTRRGTPVLKAAESATRKRISSVLSNRNISELLAQQAERETGILSRAFRRAARSAFLWPDEVSDLVAKDRPLTELRSVGPFIGKQIQNWIDKPPRRAKTVPAIRRDFMSLAEARRLLASQPAWRHNLRGDLQMHTCWSDGSGTIPEMAEAAADRSYEYIAITDHSKGLKIAGGINERALKLQGVEIAKINAALSKSATHVTVLQSIEMNLNPRGEGDMSPDSLRSLDLVLGSFHSALRTTEDQTERYLAALRNPHIHILGHPRGRIYNFRLGLTADWPRVFAEAARLGKALEIDCYPDRQDLNVELLKVARENGTRISLGTDAHHDWQLEFIDLGLAAALRAKIMDDRILNFMPVLELKTWAQRLPDRTVPKR